MGALDHFTPPRAAGAAVLLGTVNPKNLLFIVGGAAAVAQTGIPAGEQAGAWAVFCVLASLGVAAPVVIYFAMGKRAAGLLEATPSPASQAEWAGRRTRACCRRQLTP
jgi:threonine/homoserine/homoserine lactone efflux protein